MSNNLQGLVASTINNNVVDTSLLDDKELELKAINLSGGSFVINTELLEIPGDIECAVLRCDSIITESGSGLGTELVNVTLKSSTIDGTRIGQSNPKQIRTTQLDVFSTGTYQSTSIKTDGDINLLGSLLNKRYIRSTGSFVMDNSFDTMITTEQDLNLVSRNSSIYLNAPGSITFVAGDSIELSKVLTTDVDDSTDLGTGSIQSRGGISANKSCIIGENLTIYKNTNVLGNLNIIGNIVFGGETLAIIDDSLIFKAINLTGELDSISPTTGTMKVTGGAGIMRNLVVGGDAIIYKNLTARGNINILDNLNVSNQVVIYNNLNIISNVNMINNLNVMEEGVIHKNLTTNNSLNVLEDGNIYKNLNVSGNLNIVDGLNVTKEVVIHKNIVNYGNINILDGGNIYGNINVGGNMVITDNLNVLNISVFSRNVNIWSNLNVIENLNVSKESIFNKNMNVISNLNVIENLNVSKESIFNKNMNVISNLNVIENLNVSKESIFNKNMNVISNLNVIDNLNVSKESTFNKNMNVISNLNIIDNLNVSKESKFNKNINVVSNLNVVENLSVGSESIFGGNLNIYSNCIVNDRLVLNNVLLYSYYTLSLSSTDSPEKSIFLSAIVNVVVLSNALSGNYTLTLNDSTIDGQEILIVLEKDSGANLNGNTLNVTNSNIWDVDNSNPSSLNITSGGNNMRLIWLSDHWQVLYKHLA